MNQMNHAHKKNLFLFFFIRDKIVTAQSYQKKKSRRKERKKKLKCLG